MVPVVEDRPKVGLFLSIFPFGSDKSKLIGQIELFPLVGNGSPYIIIYQNNMNNSIFIEYSKYGLVPQVTIPNQLREE